MISRAAAFAKGIFANSGQSALALLAWLYIYLVGLLGAWIVIVMIGTGWQPVVVTTGSMNPTLRPGDVLLVEDHPEELVGQRTVITFESGRGDGEFITHRVFEVLPEERVYITKGDANSSPDTDHVRPEQVSGVGRLVVPLIGLPAVWAQGGNLPALASVAILSIAAVFVAYRSRRTAMLQRKDTLADRASPMADRAIRRVRMLVGLMILSQFFLDRARFEVGVLGLSTTQLLVIAIGGLAGINAMSVRAERYGDPTRVGRYAMAELSADTFLVVLLTTGSGGGGIGWVLIALPIVEAAVRFRLAGALLHWMAMAGVTLAARLWVLERSDAALTETISELDQLLDQLGVLLLVVIPGAYLAEQLVTDVVRQGRATDQALERGQLLEHVAAVGHEVNRMGADLFETMVSSALTLGFDRADVWVQVPSDGWRILATAGADDVGALPEPGHAGSGLCDDELSTPEVLVDKDDPDLGEFLPLAGAGLAVLARITVSTTDGTYIALRAAVAQGSEIAPASVDALRLLCGQATVALQNKQLVTELREVHVELEHQAMHDGLTGLPNRVYFLDQLKRGLAAATDPRTRHAVLFLDLNGFKQVNDTLGHDAGDELLKLVGDRLVSAVGAHGLVARLGGDEFTVLCKPVSHPSQAVGLASQIHAAFTAPFKLEADAVSVGASIGIAFAEAGLGESEILRRADAAMYTAKSRNDSTRIATYHPEMDEAERRRGRMAAEFKKALDNHELELAFQPVVSARSGDILGAEALLRWNHRETGAVNTATILELAEVSKRVDDLNAWILVEALGVLRRCNIPDERDFYVAVNVSPSELASPRLLTNISDALLMTGLPADRLVIELSERIVASGGGQNANIAGIGELGVDLSLDDFGEGRTSLGHLRGLPISQLKLDRMLVQQACSAETEADRIILESVISLAHDLDFDVVAEGIEVPSQRKIVTEAGADLLQGYGIYRPMPADEFRDLLDRLGVTATVVEPSDPADSARPGAQEVRH